MKIKPVSEMQEYNFYFRRTNYVVRPSTDEDKELFHEQVGNGCILR